MSQSKKIKRVALIGMFIGIELVLMLTPLGYIPIGPIKATTLHIPVILLALLLGEKEGAILGLVFGCTSVLMNTLAPTPFSFCFSPFYSLGEVSGNLNSLIIALVPRILIGVGAGLAFKGLRKMEINENLAVLLSSIVGSFANTILVMGGIYIFFGPAYASQMGITVQALIGVIQTTIFVNGVIEAVVGAAIIWACYRALKSVTKGNL